MGRIVRALVAVVVVCSFPAPALARDCVFAGNLVTNCGFEFDLSDWAFTASPPAHRVTDNCATAPGCVELDRHDGVNSIEALSSCFDVTPSTSYAVGVSVRHLSGMISTGCFIDLRQFAGSACGTFVTESFALRRVSPVWRELIAGVTTGGAIGSAEVRLTCFSAEDFTIRADDFFLVATLFVDGFETGNTSAWSSSMP